MLISRAGNTIVITIENFWDWMDLFDNGVADEISFDLDAEILDAFFPDWDTYVDSDRPFESLKMDDLKQIDTICKHLDYPIEKIFLPNVKIEPECSEAIDAVISSVIEYE